MAEESNPILAGLKRVPAQAVFGLSDLVNMAAGVVAGKGLSGVTPKSPSETVNQDVFGLAEPDLFSAQGATELVAGFISPAKGIAAGARALGVALPALITLMNTASAGQKILNKQAGIIGGMKAAEVLGVEEILKKAERMFVQGSSQHKIAQETAKDLKEVGNPGQAMSVFMGPDNKPRLVMGNVGSKVAEGKQFTVGPYVVPMLKGEEIPLSDMLLHPTLYDTSQRAATATVRVNPELNSGNAQYLPEFNRVELAKDFKVPASLKNDPEEYLAQVLRHEGGHIVQLDEGHRLGTSNTVLSLKRSVEDAISSGSFTDNPTLYQMQKDLHGKSRFPTWSDLIYEKEFLKLYNSNYGEWEAELGSKMNPTTFPMMYERGKTW